MKKTLFLTIFILSGFVSASYAQNEMDRDQPPRHPPLEKIEQLEKAKLVELLDLKEDEAVRFFARRKEFRKSQRELFEKRDDIVKGIEKKLRDGIKQSDKEYKDQLNDILNLDQKIVQQKEKFFSSLNDILTPEQILKLAVFDNRFMHEIRELLMGRKRNKK
jgi:malate synthase